LKAPPEEDAVAVIDGKTWLEHISDHAAWDWLKRRARASRP
jgi:hypothetical protein